MSHQDPRVHGLKRLAHTVLSSPSEGELSESDMLMGATEIASFTGMPHIRGYPLQELAEQATFLEVAFLLLAGELPTREFLADFQTLLTEAADIPVTLQSFVETLPVHASRREVQRSALSVWNHFQEDCEDRLTEAARLLAVIPGLIVTREHAGESHPEHDFGPDPEGSFPANVLQQLTPGFLSPEAERAIEVCFILHAVTDYDAPTRVVRNVAASGGDLTSAIVAAIGCGNAPAFDFDQFETPEDWEASVRERLAQNRRIPGFEHRENVPEPRAHCLAAQCRAVADAVGTSDWEESVTAMEQLIDLESGQSPTLDWVTARLFFYLGVDSELASTVLVVAQCLGWMAHFAEQIESPECVPSQLCYAGPWDRTFRSLS